MTEEQSMFVIANPIVAEFAEMVHMSPRDLARHPAMSLEKIPGTRHPVRFLTLGFMQWFSGVVGRSRFCRDFANPAHVVMGRDWREDASEDDERAGVFSFSVNLPTDEEITNTANSLLNEIALILKPETIKDKDN